MGRLSSWPVLRQLRARADGTGREAESAGTARLHARTEGAAVARSVCPYCAVGCGQLVYHRDGRVLSIEGDPASPISGGTLCPKGAASRELLTHAKRLTRVLYRRPRGTAWETLPLEQAMDMVADRVWESRRRTFLVGDEDGPVRHTAGVVHLGGATLDNEENYLIKKLFTGGLGMVGVSNQARI